VEHNPWGEQKNEKAESNGNSNCNGKTESNGNVVDERNLLQKIMRLLLSLLIYIAKFAAIGASCMWAYRIRLHGIKIFGYLVHGWDPTFNNRAAKYLAKHGWHAFFHWYDTMSWYPLGRPVGTTIYPGMQIFVVWVWEAMKSIPKVTYSLPEVVTTYVPRDLRYHLPGEGTLAFGPLTLNQVTCLSGAWLGGVATFFIALLTAETSESLGAGVVAAFVMAGIPAHLMRSMAGEFDNEAVAMSCFCATFWLWCRSLRTPGSWPWGFLAAIAYITAVATWGGYIFVNNLIGLHAAFLVAVGKYNSNLYRAYSLWYVFGTAGATFVPVVNWTPLKSLEQMPSLCVFLGFQVLELCDIYRKRLKNGMTAWRFFFFRVMVFASIGVVVAGVSWILLQMGHFQPLSSRIRGLFLKHRKTGNPLVDSVAEHSASTTQAYEIYLGVPRLFAVVGLGLCWHQRTPAKSFPFLFALVAWHFSLKMNRLIIICGPITSMLAGYPIGIVADWCIEQFIRLFCGPQKVAVEKALPERSGGMGSIIRRFWKNAKPALLPKELSDLWDLKNVFATKFWWIDRPIRIILAAGILTLMQRALTQPAYDFIYKCDQQARGMANPGIAYEASLKNGETIIVDDELKGYQWLKKNTPNNSRVMSWWDYGYQITGIGDRTSMADGNTWNHEHIATLGRILSAQEKRSHNIQRHLADYVLVKVGHGETDLRISTHFARIGNSVFPDICGSEDPTCNKYGFEYGGGPSKMMAESFVYRAVKHGGKEGVRLNSRMFKEVHTTPYRTIRIFQVLNVSQESKDWVADPANRICDAPGSWYCVGQYPPPLKSLISKRKNFAQLEDFNKKGQEKSAYTKYLEQKQAEGIGEL
jgi:dolichyl-diphosphooligosaccharide--protein glycosyltransferase